MLLIMVKFLFANLVIGLFLIQNCFTQQIKIVDAKNNQYIPNVHICTESTDKVEMHYWVTNEKGMIQNSLKQKSKVAISFVGYKTLTDSIEPGKSYTFKLIPHSENINEVVITGQINPETIDKSIYKVQVINSVDIKNKAANNLGDLLNNELNISINNSGILGSSLQMQGLSGEHIKILINGVPVIGRQNGNIDLGQLNLQNVDHIEIVEGPMSVVYGSNALAGAINIITKKNIRPKFEINTNAYLESVGQYNFDLAIIANIKKHHLSVTGSRNFFNGYTPEYSLDTNSEEAVFNFSPKSQYSSVFNYGYNSKKFKLNFSQDYFYEKLISYGTVYTSGEIIIDDTTYSFQVADDAHHITKRWSSKLDLNYKISEKSAIDVMGAFSYYNKTKNTYHKNLYYLTDELNIDETKHDTTYISSLSSRGTYSRLLSKIELQGGYDIVVETGDGKRIVETQQIGDYAGFISLKYNPFAKLSFQGGARAIYNTKFSAPIVYSINGKYNPIESVSIRASYGTGFRSPSIKELYLYFVDINHEVIGNPDLEPEYSQNISLAINYKNNRKKNKCSYSFNFYHNKIRNKIDFLYDSINSSKAEYINIDGIYKTIGAQFDFEYRLHPRLTFKTGISYYGQSKIANLNQYTFTPDYIASLNYRNVAYHFRVNLYYKYNGKRSQFYESQENGEDIITEQYVSAYNMMDLSISKPFFDDKLNISTGIKNLFDVTTVDGSSGGSSHSGSSSSSGQSSIAWGRTFFLKLNYTFTKF